MGQSKNYRERVKRDGYLSLAVCMSFPSILLSYDSCMVIGILRFLSYGLLIYCLSFC